MPFPSPGDLPNPGIEPSFPALQADSLPAELQGSPLCSLHVFKSLQNSAKLRTLAYRFLGLVAQSVKNLPAVQETQV